MAGVAKDRNIVFYTNGVFYATHATRSTAESAGQWYSWNQPCTVADSGLAGRLCHKVELAECSADSRA